MVRFDRKTLILFVSFFKKSICFNWKITLQYYDGFCRTSTWISHRYTRVPPFWTPPLPSSPPHPSVFIYLYVYLIFCVLTSLSRKKTAFKISDNLKFYCVLMNGIFSSTYYDVCLMGSSESYGPMSKYCLHLDSVEWMRLEVKRSIFIFPGFIVPVTPFQWAKKSIACGV